MEASVTAATVPERGLAAHLDAGTARSAVWALSGLSPGVPAHRAGLPCFSASRGSVGKYLIRGWGLARFRRLRRLTHIGPEEARP
jgi:hypothetical protein